MTPKQKFAESAKTELARLEKNIAMLKDCIKNEQYHSGMDWLTLGMVTGDTYKAANTLHSAWENATNELKSKP
jgi:hypothetical protein